MATVDVNGTELFYRERGRGSPILLIHGLGGSADVWGEAFELLSEHHRVVAYDRRGFSRSVHAPVSGPQPHREDAGALLRALDAAPATVVGWSSACGGTVLLPRRSSAGRFGTPPAAPDTTGFPTRCARPCSATASQTWPSLPGPPASTSRRHRWRVSRAPWCALPGSSANVPWCAPHATSPVSCPRLG